jgi:hypothetical protein
LEKAKIDLQVLMQTLDGGMLGKKKSLLATKKSFESLVQEPKELQKDLVTCERKCQGCSNLVDLDQVRVTTTKLGANLKDVEVELQFHELLLVKREFNKVKDGKVEFKNVNERLQHVSKELDALVLKGDCASQWAQTFGHQIQLRQKIEVVNKCPTSATINVVSLPFTNCRYKFISFETLCWSL